MEDKLREFIGDLLKKTSIYGDTAIEWAFGAISFAYDAELISYEVFQQIQKDFGLNFDI